MGWGRKRLIFPIRHQRNLSLNRPTFAIMTFTEGTLSAFLEKKGAMIGRKIAAVRYACPTTRNESVGFQRFSPEDRRGAPIFAGPEKPGLSLLVNPFSRGKRGSTFPIVVTAAAIRQRKCKHKNLTHD
jgi:hypothetical protein